MSYITLGTATQLQIKVPIKGITDWADVLRTDTFLKIAEHAHTGAGDGSPIGTGSVLNDAITGAKIRLAHNEYLKARNQANSDNVSILRVTAGDELEIAPLLMKATMKHNTYVTSQDDVGNPTNLIKTNASNLVELGAKLADYSAEVATLDEAITPSIKGSGSATLVNNTSVAASASVLTLSVDESAAIHFTMKRSTDLVQGVLEVKYGSTDVIREEFGPDVGISFSMASNQLHYISTNTGNNTNFSYIILKK